MCLWIGLKHLTVRYGVTVAKSLLFVKYRQLTGVQCGTSRFCTLMCCMCLRIVGSVAICCMSRRLVILWIFNALVPSGGNLLYVPLRLHRYVSLHRCSDEVY
jgi:hypothetical protein